ncbi:hypothetical protein SAMN04487850_1174 [Prevotella aff. ruminicola Tc2-24]|uniref:Uncharacterized protein n=1 Tax=Prevotella aff. ruminicola Tc2-24 TaxID=81582 RepID=A0A1I0NE75_9BACT|nr:hypothetical protein SAMN04487850_1174 [Prevotella aff. ruminicola Tc2-24]
MKMTLISQFIFSRLKTKRINPLIFSSNVDSQWVKCSPNDPIKL